jgi:hypothetical protein
MTDLKKLFDEFKEEMLDMVNRTRVGHGDSIDGN